MIKQWQKNRQIDAQIGSEIYSFIVPISYIKLLDKAGSVEREIKMLLSDKSIHRQFNNVSQKNSYEYLMESGMELDYVESLFDNDSKQYTKYLVWLILSDELERIREEEEERERFKCIIGG